MKSAVVNIILLCILTIFHGEDLKAAENPSAVKGFIDLSQWDFASQGPIDLRGEWLFWQEQFIDRNSFNDDLLSTAKPMEGFWSYARQGYGTYYLRIRLPPSSNNQELSLASWYLISAAEIDVLNSDFPTRVQGQISSTKEGSIRWDGSRVDPVKMHGDNASEIELLIRISNYEYRKGGIRKPLTIGLSRDLRNSFLYDYSLSLSTSSILFVLGVYHLILYLLRKEKVFTVMYSVVAFSAAIRGFVSSRIIESTIDIGPAWYAAINYKMEYFTLVVGPYFFYNFFYHLIPNLKLSQRFSKALLYWSIGLGLVTLVFNYFVLSQMIYAYQATILIVPCYLIYKLTAHALTAAQYRFESKATLFFLLISASSFVNDILYANGVYNSVYLSSYSLTFFFGGVSLILARNFSIAFERVDQKNQELVKQKQSTKHLVSQLKKLVYPHQVKHLRAGGLLEESMPIKTAESCILAFDVQDSTAIGHSAHHEFFETLMTRCHSMMMGYYNPKEMKANAFMIKEMGDGFLCSVGFPFIAGDDPCRSAYALAEAFIEIFKALAREQLPGEKVFCSIGLSFGEVSGFFPKAGLKNYDLYGESIILATRYEAFRKTLFRRGVHKENIIIVQDKVFDRLSKDMQKELCKFNLDHDKVRSDPKAERLYFRRVTDDHDGRVEVLKKRILLVDDDEEIIAILSSLLEEEGYQVTALSDSREAMALIEKDRFEILISDIYMQETSGYEVIQKGRQAGFPKVIAMSGGKPGVKWEALQHGATDFVAKPIRDKELLNTLKAA